MQTTTILDKLFHLLKTIGTVALGAVVMLVEAIGKLLSRLNVGQRVVSSGLTEKIGIRISAKEVEKVLSIALCVLLFICLLTMCSSDKQSSSGSGFGDSDICSACSGSGDCRSCGGDGYYVFAGEEKACGSCGSLGDCLLCNGRGRD